MLALRSGRINSSLNEIQLIKKRQQLRATTKAEFLKRYRNPFLATAPGHFVSNYDFIAFVFVDCVLCFINKLDPQNARLYAYQQNGYRYLYSSPRLLLAPALFVLVGGLVQYLAQRKRVIQIDFFVFHF